MRASDPKLVNGLWAPVTRSFIALFILTVLGFSIHPPFSENKEGMKDAKIKFKFHLAFLWAAMTNFFIAAPKVGSIAKVGLQHVLGTLLGGLSGVGIIAAADASDHLRNVYWFTFGMCMVAIVSNLFAWRFKMPDTSMLFVISCVLIVFATENIKSASMFNETRVFGMVGGVLLSQLMAVLVFPKAATQEVVQCMGKVLEGLANLNDVAWVHAGLHARLQDQSVSGNVEKQSGKASWRKLSQKKSMILNMRSNLKWLKNPRQLDDKGFIRLSLGACKDGKCDVVQEMVTGRLEAALMQVYQGLDMMEAAIPLTRTEVAIEFFRGKWFFLPGIQFIKRQPLPESDIADVAWSIRKCARILWTLNMTFQDGLDQEMVYMLKKQYPRDMIQNLKKYAHDCYWDMVDVFPSGDNLDSSNIDKLEHGVQALFAINDYHRRRVAQHFNRYKNLASQNEARYNPEVIRLQNKASRVLRTLTEPGPAGFFTGMLSSLTTREDPEMSADLATLMREMDQESGLSKGHHHQRTISNPHVFDNLEVPEPVVKPREALERLGSDVEVTHGEEIVSPAGGSSDPIVKLNVPEVASKDLITFPDTPEGYVSMVRWYSFQFLLEEVVKSTRELGENLKTLLSKMPDYGVA